MRYLVSVCPEMTEIDQLTSGCVTLRERIAVCDPVQGEELEQLRTNLQNAEGKLEAELVKWAPAGEPVVPWYPSTLENVFLSVTSFKRAPYAKVADIPDLDPDQLATKLKAEYPGLPGGLHDEYVLAMARTALEFPIDTTFQIFIKPNEATLKQLGKDDLHVLWEQQPLPTSRKVEL